MIRDINGNEIPQSEVDLTKGYLSRTVRIRPDATPIDDIVKFAWDDTDYEEFDLYILYTEEELASMNTPNPDDDRDQMLVDQEYRITLLELGLV